MFAGVTYDMTVLLNLINGDMMIFTLFEKLAHLINGDMMLLTLFEKLAHLINGDMMLLTLRNWHIVFLTFLCDFFLPQTTSVYIERDSLFLLVFHYHIYISQHHCTVTVFQHMMLSIITQ